MMTITPTRRSWFTSGRLVLAVLLMSLGSSVTLLLTGAESSSVTCVASAQ